MADDLSNLFNALTPNEHGELVQRFQMLANLNNADVATFFLESSGWNLESALAEYFDSDMTRALELSAEPNLSPPQLWWADTAPHTKMALPPNITFSKTFLVRNVGSTAWPASCYLQQVKGTDISMNAHASLPSLEPGNECYVSLECISPSSSGTYASAFRAFWRSNEGTGFTFGDEIWVTVEVEEDVTLQRLQEPTEMLRGLDLGGTDSPHMSY